MDVTIQVDGRFIFTVEGTAHPTHAVNRVKKFLRENTFAIARIPGGFGYRPESPITIQFDEMDLSRRVDIDDVVEPKVWFDRNEQEALDHLLRHDGELRRKLQKLIDENNPF